MGEAARIESMEDLVSGELKILVQSKPPHTFEVHWTGKSNARNPGATLLPYFTALLRNASETSSSIEMHFERLEHFNSSTITAIIQLIQDARAHNLRITLYFDPLVKWQKLSFDALRVFSKGDGLLELRGA